MAVGYEMLPPADLAALGIGAGRFSHDERIGRRHDLRIGNL